MAWWLTCWGAGLQEGNPNSHMETDFFGGVGDRVIDTQGSLGYYLLSWNYAIYVVTDAPSASTQGFPFVTSSDCPKTTLKREWYIQVTNFALIQCFATTVCPPAEGGCCTAWNVENVISGEPDLVWVGKWRDSQGASAPQGLPSLDVCTRILVVWKCLFCSSTALLLFSHLVHLMGKVLFVIRWSTGEAGDKIQGGTGSAIQNNISWFMKTFLSSLLLTVRDQSVRQWEYRSCWWKQGFIHLKNNANFSNQETFLLGQ